MLLQSNVIQTKKRGSGLLAHSEEPIHLGDKKDHNSVKIKP